MTFVRFAWAAALGLAVTAGCGNAGNPGSSSSTTTSSATTGATTTGTGGAGGSGGGAGGTAGAGGMGTTSGVGGSGAGHFACSGQSVSLANDIVPITKVNCGAVAGCHTPLKTAAGTYQYLVGRLADQCTELRLMVEPSHPEKSYLVDKITGTNMCSGDSMPKGKPMLPDAEIQLMVDWICEGAPEN
ncbi:MAG: hypothetical protein ABI193_26920 [Minicystis sp.]